MTIIRIVQKLGQSYMHVLVEYRGMRKNIKLSWKRKISSDVPPFDWVDLVRYEVESEWSKVRNGRLLF